MLLRNNKAPRWRAKGSKKTKKSKRQRRAMKAAKNINPALPTKEATRNMIQLIVLIIWSQEVCRKQPSFFVSYQNLSLKTIRSEGKPLIIKDGLTVKSVVYMRNCLMRLILNWRLKEVGLDTKIKKKKWSKKKISPINLTGIKISKFHSYLHFNRPWDG